MFCSCSPIRLAKKLTKLKNCPQPQIKVTDVVFCYSDLYIISIHFDNLYGYLPKKGVHDVYSNATYCSNES